MAVAVAPDVRMFVDGRSVEASDGAWLDVHNPATGGLVGRVPAGTAADVDRAVAAARDGGFKQSGFGKDMSSYSFEEYTQVKHVMIELTGEPEKDWQYTIFGDPKS